jgi:uncharacterized protein Yka (UPF0111/DUF47 family)
MDDLNTNINTNTNNIKSIKVRIEELEEQLRVSSDKTKLLAEIIKLEDELDVLESDTRSC